MNSDTFFTKYGKEIRGKSGVYVLENPLEYQGQRIFKIGYAHDSLYTRIRGYKTAYGPIQFKIHAVWHVPEGVFNKRLMTALQTERHLHDILHKYIVMKDENDKKLGEWYYNIQEILTAVETTRAKEIAIVVGIDEAFYFISDEVGNLTRSKAKTVPKIDPDEQSSKFKGLTMRNPSKRNKPSKKYNSDEYELEPNKSREKKKNKYVARVKTISG
jgi:hypothetical protein